MLSSGHTRLAFQSTGDAVMEPCFGQPFPNIETLPGLETTDIYGQHFVVFKVKVKVKSLSPVRLFATLWTVAH